MTHSEIVSVHDSTISTPWMWRVSDCMSACPVDGRWSSWSSWSRCSPDCQRYRRRRCDSPPPSSVSRQCAGFDVDSELCAQPDCSLPLQGLPSVLCTIPYCDQRENANSLNWCVSDSHNQSDIYEKFKLLLLHVASHVSVCIAEREITQP